MFSVTRHRNDVKHQAYYTNLSSLHVTDKDMPNYFFETLMGIKATICL